MIMVCCHCLRQLVVSRWTWILAFLVHQSAPAWEVLITRSRAVVTLKKNTLSCCAGLDVHHMHLRVKRGSVTQLGFPSLCRKDKKGCRRREEKDVIWNELLGQGGGQEHGEAALEMRKYQWSRA